MFSQNFTNFLASPNSRMLEEYSASTETPQFSIECESNPELNYTKFINLEESDEDKTSHKSISHENVTNTNTTGNFFKPIFSNLQQFVSSQLNQSDYLKLIEKSKRIIKRENAKKRVKMAKLQKKDEESPKKEEEIEPPKKVLPVIKPAIKTIEKSSKKGSEQSLEKGSNDKDMKKVIQKLRNRISAQQSRDRKKMYLENLERENQILQEEIKALKENRQLESNKDKEEKKMNLCVVTIYLFLCNFCFYRVVSQSAELFRCFAMFFVAAKT